MTAIAISDGLVAGLHQDLVNGDVVGLPQRVNYRCGDVFEIQDARSAGP